MWGVIAATKEEYEAAQRRLKEIGHEAFWRENGGTGGYVGLTGHVERLAVEEKVIQEQHIEALEKEVELLRGLLASVEFGGECNFCNRACLFCMACHCSNSKRVHAPGCLAFTPDGKLKSKFL